MRSPEQSSSPRRRTSGLPPLVEDSSSHMSGPKEDVRCHALALDRRRRWRAVGGHPPAPTRPVLAPCWAVGKWVRVDRGDECVGQGYGIGLCHGPPVDEGGG